MWGAIDGGRGAENQPARPVLLHRLHQGQGAGDVVLVVSQGHLNRFAHRLEPGEVDDCIDAARRQDSGQRLGVEQVDLVEVQVAVGQGFDTV